MKGDTGEELGQRRISDIPVTRREHKAANLVAKDDFDGQGGTHVCTTTRNER